MPLQEVSRKCAIPGCNRDVPTGSKTWGGYVVNKGITLCKEHWEVWIEMRYRHYNLEESFLRGEQ